MCGIFGHTLAKEPLDLAASREALNVLTHRGPDQWGDWHDEAVYIGHRRLSILDLSERARQPMVARCGTARDVVIAVNGEIWNHRELRGSLSPKYSFGSNSDSEVVLHGYREYGLHGLLGRIDGMYAFALYDRQQRKLFLVRDRYGVKPLFLVPPCGATRHRFLFASEIKAFFAFADRLRVFSLDGVCHWLVYRNGRSPATIYHNIWSVPPGHYLAVDTEKGTHEVHEYYNVLDHATADGQADPGEFGSLFAAAVEKRLMSDVPLGLQLSGGVDSSLVAQQLVRGAGQRHCNSFTIGFASREQQPDADERYARQVAGGLGLVHHQVNLTRQDVAEAYPTVVYLTDGMLAYPNTIPIYLLSKYAKSLVTVQLTGEGADELFGGYTKFAQALRLANSPSVGDLLRALAAPLRHGAPLRSIRRSLFLRKRYGNDAKQIIDHLDCYITRETVDRLFGAGHTTSLYESTFGTGRHATSFTRLPFYRQLLLANHLTYLVTLLERQDRASMGASIESRVPFLDRPLVEWAVKLDGKHLFGRKETKVLLKERCANLLGVEVASRQKVGFPLPIAKWLKLDGFAEHVDKIRSSDFVLRDAMDRKYLAARMSKQGFDNVLLNYGDPETIWLRWFLMVLRTAQDVFDISDVRS